MSGIELTSRSSAGIALASPATLFEISRFPTAALADFLEDWRAFHAAAGRMRGTIGAETMPSMSSSSSSSASSSSKGSNPLVSLIDRRLDAGGYREQHWEGTFWEY